MKLGIRGLRGQGVPILAQPLLGYAPALDHPATTSISTDTALTVLGFNRSNQLFFLKNARYKIGPGFQPSSDPFAMPLI